MHHLKLVRNLPICPRANGLYHTTPVRLDTFMHSTAAPPLYSNSPFVLENEASYQRWRQWKLDGYPLTAEELIVEVTDPRRLSRAEIAEMLRICRKTNMVI